MREGDASRQGPAVVVGTRAAAQALLDDAPEVVDVGAQEAEARHARTGLCQFAEFGDAAPVPRVGVGHHRRRLRQQPEPNGDVTIREA